VNESSVIVVALLDRGSAINNLLNTIKMTEYTPNDISSIPKTKNIKNEKEYEAELSKIID